MSDKTIVWVHGDCLSPYNPALQHYPEAPALWVWDDELRHEWRISLKRVLFIYECLLDLPVVIRRGTPLVEIIAFAQKHQAGAIATADSPSPRFAAVCEKLREAGLVINIYPVDPFLNYDGDLDLKRFSRYWRVAKQHLFDPEQA